MNETWKPTKLVTWNQAAFYIMTSIMALFVIVKNFLWAKYAHEGALKADSSDYDEHPHVTISESSLGNNAQTERKPFGFTPSQPAPSSAATNRAKLQTVEKPQVHDRIRDTVDGIPSTGIRYTGIESVKAANVGQTVNCPVCGTAFVKANKWHLFCSNSRKKKADGASCADTYYNSVEPSRIQHVKTRKR